MSQQIGITHGTPLLSAVVAAVVVSGSGVLDGVVAAIWVDGAVCLLGAALVTVCLGRTQAGRRVGKAA